MTIQQTMKAMLEKTAASGDEGGRMKLSELRPCDSCGGRLAPGPFYVVRASLAFFSPDALNATLGLTTMFARAGHAALGLAEVMSPDPHAVKIAGDEDKRLQHEIFLCNECALMKEVILGQLLDRAQKP